MRLALIIGLTFALNASAAIKVRDDGLVRARSEVMELGARLSSLEKEIGSKNNLYISSIEQIRQFEGDIKLYRDKLTELHLQVRQAQSENKKIFKSYLIESENEGTEDWQKKVHLELLKQAQNKLKTRESELISFENKVTEFDAKLISLKTNEEELANVIQELEARKKVAMEL